MENEIEMEKEQRESEKFVEKLYQDGHTCVIIYETYPQCVDWCGQKVCMGKIKIEEENKTEMEIDMEKRQKESEEFVKKLRKDEHTCIIIKESYPQIVRWCEQQVCVNKVKTDK